MSKRKFPIALCPSGMRMPKYTLKILSNFTIYMKEITWRGLQVITNPGNSPE